MTTQAMNIIAVISGPVIAVLITLFYQHWKEKRDTKIRLFLTLMAHRGSNPPTLDWANALNLIDVVFSGYPKVVKLWHDYFDLLCQRPAILQTQQHKYLDLLSEMAKNLGYKDLQQTDIDKFYTPIAHGDQKKLETKIQQELLKVLENTERFLVVKKDNKTS